jgi:hypothetical protein
MEKHEAEQLCQDHMYRYVLVHTVDQIQVDGIVESVDENNLYLAEPACEDQSMESRQPGHWFGYPGGFGYGYGWHGYPGYGYGWHGYPWYGYGYGYPGYGWYPRNRFRRRVLPLGSLAGLTLLPYFI